VVVLAHFIPVWHVARDVGGDTVGDLVILGFILGVVAGMLLTMGGITLALMVLDEEDKERGDQFNKFLRELEERDDTKFHTIH
jgi:hypothetical protein